VDRSETLARNHLVYRGYEHSIYEPDGNVPPDFVLEGRIAVEVRRLNENERDTPSPKGLEETEIPLLMGLQKLIKSFGSASSKAWWVALRYRRPFPTWATLAAPARAFLEDISDGRLSARVSRHIDKNVELEAIPRSGTGGDVFHVAIMSDDDSGGWVLEELERNLRLCIDEKTAKVAKLRHKYPIWWLLLIDQVSYGLTEFDRAQFQSSVRIEHTWDKVILVNPLDHTHYFEL